MKDKPTCQYTVEELKEVPEKSEADIAAGRCRPNSEVFKDMEHKFPWLK